MTPPSDAAAPGSANDWLRHAESDLHFARLGRADAVVMRNQPAFHAQQAAEKAIKAVLLHHQVRFPKTHDLEVLIELIALARIPWPFTTPEVEALTPYAVELRYPGGFADVSLTELDEAIASAETVLTWAKATVK